jgi:hypothetical protein
LILYPPSIPKPPPPLSSTPTQKSIEIHKSGGGIIDSMTQGFGFGIGSSIARRIFSPSSPSSNPNLNQDNMSEKSINSCDLEYLKLQDCFEKNADCDKLYKDYLNCKENN